MSTKGIDNYLKKMKIKPDTKIDLALLIELMDGFSKEEYKDIDANRWISVKDKPLIHQNNLGWKVNKGVPDEFLAALRVTNKIDGKTSWWIRHCVIEDETGLCVVGDDENEPCGWQITDIEFYQPLPQPPKQSKL